MSTPPNRPNVTLATLPAIRAPVAPPQFKVELDDRAILLPDGKVVQHLVVTAQADGRIRLDGVFAFNVMGRSPHILTMTEDDAAAFTAELIAAVYAAKTSFMFSERLKMTITVVANGYRLEVQDGQEGQDSFELYLSTGVIWRVIKGLLAAIDALSRPQPN
jgi:hypothetical protein